MAGFTSLMLTAAMVAAPTPAPAADPMGALLKEIQRDQDRKQYKRAAELAAPASRRTDLRTADRRVLAGLAAESYGDAFQHGGAPRQPRDTLLWFAHEAPSGVQLQYGSDVVLDSQGRALVAGAVTEKGALRGYVFAPYSAQFCGSSLQPFSQGHPAHLPIGLAIMMWMSKSASLSCRSTLPLQPSGCAGPKSSIVPTSRSRPVLMPLALPGPAESSSDPVVVDVLPLVELAPVDAGAVVTPGPVEMPGDDGSAQAARTRAARRGLCIAYQA